MLVNLKSKINKIPQFPDKASTTKINLFLNNILKKILLVEEKSKVNIKSIKAFFYIYLSALKKKSYENHTKVNSKISQDFAIFETSFLIIIY